MIRKYTDESNRKPSLRNEVKMENHFKDLSVEELSLGYTVEDAGTAYRCIFCGETFEKGIIYTSGGKSIDACRAVTEHVYREHGGAFEALVSLDKQVNGLTDVQKKLLTSMYEGMENKEISEELDINSATVRTHKFKLQKMKREAKIFLALLEHIENEELCAYEERIKADLERSPEEILLPDNDFTGNALHPFFTNFNLK